MATPLICLKISPENVKQLSVKTSSAKRSSVSVEGSLTVRWSKKYLSAKSPSLFGITVYREVMVNKKKMLGIAYFPYHAPHLPCYNHTVGISASAATPSQSWHFHITVKKKLLFEAFAFSYLPFNACLSTLIHHIDWLHQRSGHWRWTQV